jgi:hypothetical protein
MRVKKQQIENMTKADLIKDIDPFNSKNWHDYLLFAIYIPLNHILLSFFNQSNQSIYIFIYIFSFVGARKKNIIRSFFLAFLIAIDYAQKFIRKFGQFDQHSFSAIFITGLHFANHG